MNRRVILWIVLGIFLAPFIFQLLLILFLISFVIIAENPISETLTCAGNQCSTTQNLLIGSISQNDRNIVTDKNQLELQVVHDYVGINQYYIRMRNDNERYAFRTSYLSRANAERDLKRIKENNNVRIVKRNVVLIQGFCITLYVILLVIGTIIRRRRQNIQIINNIPPAPPEQ